MLGVLPVVGDLARVVIAHHVGYAVAATARIIRVGATAFALFGLAYEAIHLTTIDVGGGIRGSMRPSMIKVLRIMVRLNAQASAGIFDAHGWLAVLHRYTICTGIGSEVGVERAVLLHDNHNMLD